MLLILFYIKHRIEKKLIVPGEKGFAKNKKKPSFISSGH